MRVTLIEGYLEQQIETPETYTPFKSKYNISAFSEKTVFFLVCLLSLFFIETADLRSYLSYVINLEIFSSFFEFLLCFFLFSQRQERRIFL